jgi:hypothetical protein
MAFDIAGARKAGYSETEIVDHLASQTKFDSVRARASGYTDAELLKYLGGEQPIVAPTPQKLAKDDIPNFGETLTIGTGRKFDKILDGITQLYLKARGETKAEAGLKTNVNEKTELYKPLQEARPIATAVGEAIPDMVIPMGGTASAAATAAKLAIPAAVSSGLEYGTAAERAKNAAISGVASVIGGQVVPAVTRVVGGTVNKGIRAAIGEMSPEKAALYARAQSLGIPVSAAQQSDSSLLKTIASTVEHVPLSGAGKMREGQQQAFNQAVSKTIGENTSKITRDVYDSARTRIGKEFDRLTDRNELRVTQELMDEVNDVIFRSQHYAGPDAEKIVHNLADKLRSKLDTNTMTIPGSVYKEVDELMGKVQGFGTQSIWVKELKDIVRKHFDNSIRPADIKAWETARSQWKNLKALTGIVARDGADGDIPPSMLMSAVTNSGAGKELMARGARGEIGEIAQIGKEFLKDKIPNSGTIQRGMALGLLGGGGMMAGMSPEEVIALFATGATSGRLANKLINTPASGARMAMVPKTLAELMKMNPSKASQIIGSGTGMTLAEMNNR